ncbi:MAG: class I SAM-dependent methyltransferase [Chloroflexota bacterium]
MSSHGASKQFDDWAETYDAEINEDTTAYPFAGYRRVLSRVAQQVAASVPVRVLDIGTGTGNLSVHVRNRNPSAEIWGIDFSPNMLRCASAKDPRAYLLQADISYELPNLTLPTFDYVVSSYVLHGIPDDARLALIQHLVTTTLRPGGTLAIGDISFSSQEHLAVTRSHYSRTWDDSEHYFVASELLASMRDRGCVGEYVQISICAGLFTFQALR